MAANGGRGWAHKGEIACVCGAHTSIVNSRGRQSRDVVYRQRVCRSCGAKFSTFESRQNPRDEVHVARALERLDGAIESLQSLKEAIAAAND